jgi:phosphoribosylglycinamide formyltransferase-1
VLTSPSLEPYPTIPGDSPVVGVLASGSGSNFEVIAEHVDAGRLDVELAGLVCNNPGARCLDRAERLGVDSSVVDHREFADRESFDRAVLERLDDWQVDWVVMAGWMRIVTDTFIDAYRDRILNLHPSLLPAFPGAHAVEDALEAGVNITGCSVHLVTEDVDDGPLVAQSAVPVHADDTSESLHERIHEAEHWLFPRAIARAIAARRS